MDKKVSFKTRICYVIGGLPYTMSLNALSSFIIPFFLEQAALRPIQVSIVLFGGRCWDSIADPFVGYLVTNTKTRFGKYRPWILFSTPAIVVVYMLIWYVPNISNTEKTFWYLGFYCLVNFFSSCQRVSYTSLIMCLTPNLKERESITGLRLFFEMLGVLLGVILQGVMITIYGAKVKCKDDLASLNQTQKVVTDPSSYNKLSEGYLISAAIISSIYLICSSITFFGTYEMKDIIVDDKKHNFCFSMKSLFTHRPFVTLSLAFFFFSISIQMLEANIPLFVKYAINARNTFQFILIILIVSCILSILVLSQFMEKLGKKRLYISGVFLAIPCMLLLLLIKNNGWHVYFLTCFFGIVVASNFLLPWSMLPDVIDDFKLKTGAKLDSYFFSIFVFANKFSSGISVSLSSIALEHGKFIDCPNGCCDQPASIKSTLRFLVSYAPIGFLLIALVFIILYPLNGKKLRENKEALNQLRESVLLDELHE